MKAVKVGNTVVVKDKIISVFLSGKHLKVNVTVGPLDLSYETEEMAQIAFEEIYNQLNKD